MNTGIINCLGGSARLGNNYLILITTLLQGTNVKVELLATTRNLPLVFAEVEDVLCNELMSQAVNCYQAFVSYAFNKERVRILTFVLSEFL